MFHHPLRASVLLSCFCLILPAPAAGNEFQILPEKSYRLDLPARKPDEKDITRDTRTVAVDVFLDKKARRLLYVGEEGKALAVVSFGEREFGPADKAPKSLHRLMLPVRKYDDKEFGEKISVEVYRDERTGNWVYVSHTGAFAVMPAGQAPGEKPAQEPKWLYRLPLRVRQFDKFEVEYHYYNVEVYHDEYTGGLLYIAENGTLAVIPAAKGAEGQKADLPAWSHALQLQVRKPGEERFGPKTSTKFSMEVYQDRNRGAWVYITEQQQLAVVPGSKAVGEKVQAPHWLQGLRPPGVAARGWNAEVYHNLDADHRVYITTSGALAAVP